MKYLPSFCALAFVFFCFCSHKSEDLPADNDSGCALISVALGPTDSLTRRIDAEPDTLTLTLSAPGKDSMIAKIGIGGNSQRIFGKTFSDVAPLTRWAVSATVKDKAGRPAYSGDTVFDVNPYCTTAVALDLPARYSTLKAKYFPIRDSVSEVRLWVDGAIVADSSFEITDLRGDTIDITRGYLTASPTGVRHTIRMDALGKVSGGDTVLYRSDTTVTTFSGVDAGNSVSLAMPDLPARYSTLKAKYFPIRDSISEVRLWIDGTIVADLSFDENALRGDTVKLSYNYLTASPSGVRHTIRMDALGAVGGRDTVLYRRDTIVTAVSGINAGNSVSLAMPDLPARYSTLKAAFFLTGAGIHEARLRVDGAIVADSLFGKTALGGDTVKLFYDYLTASPSGIRHTIRMDARSVIWSDDTVLYQGDTTVTAISGAAADHSISLNVKKTGGEKVFKVSVDSVAWSKWGFKYPVTFKFGLTDVSAFNVLRLDEETGEWQTVPNRKSGDFFNGLEAARLDAAGKLAYVSIGFATRPAVYLKFQGNATASYLGVARFYDNRKAAYTLSIDNWAGEQHPGGNPGIACSTMTDDGGDKYQAAVWACRLYNLPVSAAINTGKTAMTSVWPLIQAELNSGGLEPAVHSRTHPCSDTAYEVNGYAAEIVGCRDDLLAGLTNIPYGNRIFEFVTPCDHENTAIRQTAGGIFLFLRRWSGSSNPSDTVFAPWDTAYDYYRGGLETKSYDDILEMRSPKARYYAADVSSLNSAFSSVYNKGGIFYAMWHPDRYSNSVIYDDQKPLEGKRGSSLMQHFSYVANRADVWYAANGWVYDYHHAAAHSAVEDVSESTNFGIISMIIGGGP